jgi:O-antigen ligase
MAAVPPSRSRTVFLPLDLTESNDERVTDDLAGPLDHENCKSALRDPAAFCNHRRLRIATAAAVGYVAGLPLLRPAGPLNTGLVDLAGFVLVFAAGLAWLSGRLTFRLPFAITVLVFAVGGTLGALAGPTPGRGLMAVVQDLVLLVVSGAIVSIAPTISLQRLLWRTWAVSGVTWASLLIFGVLAHVDVLSGQQARYGARASLTTGDPNLAANYLVASLFVLYAARWPAGRLSRAAATIVVVIAMLLTGSNGATAALFLGTLAAGVAALCLKRNWRVVVGLVAMAAALVLFLGVAPVSRWQQQLVSAAGHSSVQIVRDSVGRQDQSSSTRHTLLDESLELYRTDGPLGTGPGSTKSLLEKKQYPYQKEAHDDYLAALTERGPIGAFGLALLLGVAVRMLSKLTRLHTRSAGREVVAPAPMIGCAVALAASGMFYEVLHFRQVWVYLALLAASSMSPDRGHWATRAGGRAH